MKTIFMGLFSILMFVSIENNQETKTITATFDSYEDDIYYFSKANEEYYSFEKINKDVLKKFDLKSDKYINKKFKITYKEELQSEDDEDIDDYEVLRIVKLELVK